MSEFPSVLHIGPFEAAPNEQLRAVFQPDLDEQMRFAQSTVWLTTERLLWQGPAGAADEIRLSPAVSLEAVEHAGVGELLIRSLDRPVVRFKFTSRRYRDLHAFDRVFRAPNDSIAPGTLESVSPSMPAQPTRRAPLLRLLTMTLPHWRMLVLGLLLTLAGTVAGLVPPYITMPLVDDVLIPSQSSSTPATHAFSDVTFYLGLLLAAAALAWLLSWAQGAVLAVVSERVGAELRNRAFTHLVSLDVEYFDNKRSGDLVSRISSETDRVCAFMADSLVDFISDVLMIVGTCVVLFALHPTLGFVAVASFPLIGGVILLLRRRLSDGFAHGGRVWARMASLLADAVSGIRVVKAFGQEKRETARFRAINDRIVQVNNRTNALWTFFWPLVSLLNQVGLLVVWAFGAWLVLQQQITVGVLTAYIAYIGRLYSRVESMSRMLGATQRASAAAQRLFEILDRSPSNAQSERSHTPTPALSGAIRLRDVSFFHGTRRVLNDVSFEVKAKTLVGIVGHTGSGKSTLANLLCRFYETHQGRIELDGTDIRDIPISDYRAQVGIVLQDPFLFYGSVHENIAYGSPNASSTQVVAAARSAMAHEFILRLPAAYDAAVGERGQSLSGGERQRVAIARAILVDPRILILDEATSSVDTETERQIQAALDNVAVGRTIVAIAHRLTTVRNADSIFVLKQGRLVESGTHEALLALDGEYARLWALNNQRETPPDSLLPPAAESIGPKAPRQLVSPSNLRLTLDDNGVLWMTDATSLTFPPRAVRPKRCFPLSLPEECISLVDSAGRECSFLASLGEVPDSELSALQRCLAETEWLPRIERIDRVQVNTTQSYWSVTTSRGSVAFNVDDEENVRNISNDRYVLTDDGGTTYVIPSLVALDRSSRRRFRRFS